MKKSVAILTPYIETEKEERKAAHLAAGTVNEETAGAAKILLATVKGDVHDIGKNIVGVVLGCNGYDVIDLGVMVPADKILETAERENADIIGLSGLITPSLDEMVHVAHEMKRRNMKQPLLIGGATTSRMHTAVKIAPQYANGVVHVLDASRSVTVAGNLLSDDQKKGFLATIDKEYAGLKESFDKKKTTKTYLPYAAAVANKVKINWENYDAVTPTFTGTKTFNNFDLATIAEYIDWGPFFIAWEMHGKFPQILSDAVVGKEATKLYNDAQALLKKIIDEKWFTADAVIGFWPAASNNADTISVQSGKGEVRLESLRQQIQKAPGQPNFSLADFIKPGPANDYIGAFAVTIKGMEVHRERFAKELDEYNKIMVQVLSDRLVESFAECLHALVRKEYWGYEKEEQLSNEQLIKEEYKGIRPAPGYPACPEHTEKYKLFALLDATKNTGIELTESLAMNPAASVCGWYFAHPQSQYFGIGKIQRDQMEDYAKRKGMSLDEAERWLRPVLE